MHESRVTVDGGTFHYLATGERDAPVVLCLHGFPDHPPTFAGLMQHLAGAGYRVIAPWMRGYRPSVSEGPYDVERLGLDVLELGQELSPDAPAYVVGHDWGAAAACIAVAQAPELFAAAVLMAVPHPLALARNLVRYPGQIWRSRYMLYFQVPRVAEQLVSWWDFLFIDRLWRTWSPGLRLPADAQRELHECLARSMPAPLEYYRALLRPLGRVVERVREVEGMCIAVPTRHLHGADDGCVAPEATRSQERYFSGPFVSSVLPGVGHFLHVEAPAEVARHITDWFRRWPTQSATS